MTLLAREVGHYSFLQGAYVWVDGFQWFTPQQMEILRQMERVTAQVTITLTIDEEHLEQQRRETALFHRAYEVYRDLKTLFPHLETTKVAKRPDGPLTVFRDAFFRPIPAEMTQPVSAWNLGMFRQGRRNRQRCPENRRSLSSGLSLS